MTDAVPESQADVPAVEPTRPLEHLAFVAFNGRAFAVDRYDGTIVWRYKIPKGSGFVAILLDGDRLILSAQGYTYCLDPWRGTLVWSQEFSGEGMGVPCLASVRGGTTGTSGMAAQVAAERAAQQQAATTH